MDPCAAVTMSYARLVLIGLALLLAGALAAEAPSLYLDLRFLHAARVFNENAVAEQQAKSKQSPPVDTIQQSQVHPGSPAPEKK